jgi:hypothetical protein
MKTDAAQINLTLAWLWILLGFVSGMVIGMFFHREDWLGGYASFKRRLYRLAHISFFGLGAVNLFFWLTVKTLPASNPLPAVASWAFVLGAITMPICCALMAHFPKLHLIFAVPVISLIAGAGLTLPAVMRSGHFNAATPEGQFSLPMNRPTPDPSQEGNCPRVTAPLLGGVGGGFKGTRRDSFRGNLTQMQAHAANQTRMGIAIRRMANQAGRLVDDQQVGIFVKDVQSSVQGHSA